MAEKQLDKPGIVKKVEIPLDDCYFIRVKIQHHRAVVCLYRNRGHRVSGVVLTREQWNLLKGVSEIIDVALETVISK